MIKMPILSVQNDAVFRRDGATNPFLWSWHLAVNVAAAKELEESCVARRCLIMTSAVCFSRLLFTVFLCYTYCRLFLLFFVSGTVLFFFCFAENDFLYDTLMVSCRVSQFDPESLLHIFWPVSFSRFISGYAGRYFQICRKNLARFLKSLAVKCYGGVYIWL